MGDCPACGAVLEEDAAFCSECGAKLAEVAPADGAPADGAGVEADGGEAGKAISPTDKKTTSTDKKTTPPGGAEGAGAAAEADVEDEDAPSAEDADAQYEQALHGALADGALDSADMDDLEELRESLQLSEDKARQLRREAIDRFTTRGGASGASGCPVRLAINDNHFYMNGKLGVLDFRLGGAGSASVSARLAVETAFLGKLAPWQASLAPGGQAREKIQVVPSQDGEILLNLIVRCEAGGEITVWRAQPCLMVLEPGGKGNINIDIDMSMHAGRNIGYGLSQRTDIADAVAKGMLKDNNDLMRQSFPDQWTPIDLVLDEMRTEKERAAGPTRVEPVAPVAPGAGLTRATLIPGEGWADERCIVLLAGGQARMGRRREGNDVVLRALPRSDRHDRRSLLVSGHHVLVSLRPAGLFVTDLDSCNGTELNGQRIRGDAQVPLDRPSELDVGGGLTLRLVPYLSADDPDAPAVERYTALGVEDEVWRMAERLGLRSVLIQRVGNLAEDECYLLIFRWAEIGTTAEQEVLLPPTAGQPAVARLVRGRSGLWLEGLPGASVQAGGSALPAGRGRAIEVDLTAQFGGAAAKFIAYRQCGL